MAAIRISYFNRADSYYILQIVHLFNQQRNLNSCFSFLIALFILRARETVGTGGDTKERGVITSREAAATLFSLARVSDCTSSANVISTLCLTERIYMYNVDMHV